MVSPKRHRFLSLRSRGGKRFRERCNVYGILIKMYNPELLKRYFPVINMKTVIVVVIGMFIALQVAFTIQTSTYGATLADLESEADELTKNIRQLNDKLVSSTSLTDVRNNSDILGFNTPENTLYLSTGKFVAKAP